MGTKSLGIRDRDVAAGVDRALRGAYDTLSESLSRVVRSCSEEEAAVYKDKVGEIFYIIIFHLMEPLYDDHPQLKPKSWDDPHKSSSA